MLTKLSTRPTSEKTLQRILNFENINWSKIYKIGGEVTIDTYSRMFNFKLNHNILYLNKTLTRMGILNNSFCSFCNVVDESQIHLFCECHVATEIWKELKFHFTNVINLPDLTPQSAFFGFFDIDDNKIIINHILLFFKMTLYHCRSKRTCTLQQVLENI